MLSFSHVSFTVPTLENPIVDNLTFPILRGEFVIILGANGSGKSSLLKLINGDYLPSKGVIKKEAKKIAYLSQDTSQTLFHDLTVLENCCLNDQKTQPTPFKITTRPERQAYTFYLASFHPHLPHKMEALVHTLSGGERQALALGLALKQQPDLLLLDEHTSALDPHTAEILMHLTDQAIRAHGLTALMVTHNMQQAMDYGTRVIGLKEGRIVMDKSGPHKEELTKKELMELYC